MMSTLLTTLPFTGEMAWLCVLVVLTMLLFATGWLSIEATVLLLLPVLVVTGLLDIGGALSGFASPATITIMCMFVLSAGLTRTGSLEGVIRFLRTHSRGSPLRLLLILALVVPATSAFINNTPVVVMLVPVLLSLCREFGTAPSRVLIPLSYFAILGGTCTLIGTNTNILVDQLYREFGGPGFRMFDFLPIGALYLVAGTAFILLVGRRLLPDRTTLSALLSRERTAHFVTEILVPAGSNLIGQPAGDAFSQPQGLRLLEFIREEVALDQAAQAGTPIQAGDLLIVEGKREAVSRFLQRNDIELPTVLEDDQRVVLSSVELMLGEAVVLPDSALLGKPVAELALNRRFGAKLLAIQRSGRHHSAQVRGMRIKPGDVLLLQADEKGFAALAESEEVLLVEGRGVSRGSLSQRAIAIGALGGVVVAAGGFGVPLVIAAMGGCALLFATRVLAVRAALQVIDTKVLFLLAGTIPLGHALESSGLAAWVAEQVFAGFAGAHPVLLVSVFYLMTSLLTELLSNKGTAVLLTPIAIDLAARFGLPAEAFLMAICFGASASFATPIGYATNTIVMGPGGYRFSDFLRIGLPINFVMWAIASLLIPLFWL